MNLYGFGTNSTINGFDRLGLDWIAPSGNYVSDNGCVYDNNGNSIGPLSPLNNQGYKPGEFPVIPTEDEFANEETSSPCRLGEGFVEWGFENFSISNSSIIGWQFGGDLSDWGMDKGTEWGINPKVNLGVIGVQMDIKFDWRFSCNCCVCDSSQESTTYEKLFSKSFSFERAIAFAIPVTMKGSDIVKPGKVRRRATRATKLAMQGKNIIDFFKDHESKIQTALTQIMVDGPKVAGLVSQIPELMDQACSELCRARVLLK